MPLSWNEINSRALQFTKEWEGETRERAEKDTFWNQFLNVFGITRRRVASFEQAVKKLDKNQGFIDLFWPGMLLVEHKSFGRDLEKAFGQALDYFPGLKDHELPRFIITSDFANFKLYDLEENNVLEFPLSELTSNIHSFGFIAGYEKRSFKEEDPVNIDAAYLMGRLHDSLKEVGYTDHALEVYLVRILFCLFADDTNIFERGILQEYLDLHTKEDGSDLAGHLAQIFQILNTPKDRRLKNLDENLDQFPYVNGQLFAETLPFASFDTKMRDMLLEACKLDWGKISPAIFGSMFQAAMKPKERRDLGAHYTSEQNIQKVIKPLFLDDLHKEFNSAKGSTKRLQQLQYKISKLTFLDPACGCGNFLIITYRELRQLELDILRELNKKGQGFLDVSQIIMVDVDQFYGIEYDEFPARIAEVAMWLIDHQMNMKVSEEFGQYFVRLPLSKSVTIKNANALQINWEEIISPLRLSYILGNPPFYGSSFQTKQQKNDVKLVFKDIKGAGVLDYVAGWYIKAAKYIQDTKIEVGFVSTNSVSQGEQVSVLWNELINTYGIKINFAHRTFNWRNEAKGNAGVHVVIIGFAIFNSKNKLLFEYQDIKGEPLEKKVKNINPYLIDAPDIIILKRTTPLCNVPKMMYGNKIVDGGNYLFENSEKIEFIKLEPLARKFIKPILSGDQFLNGKLRWVLHLEDITPNEIQKMPLVKERIENVQKYRAASTKSQTRESAFTPTLFAEPRQPDTNFLLIPRTSSENRRYIPFGFFDKKYIVNDSCIALPNADKFIFGVMTSLMHMTWVKYTCGRLKSDYRYSNTLVYNTFPWPENLAEKNALRVEKAAEKVLDVRASFKDSSLAQLYSPTTMPPNLFKAHLKLDEAVDRCYRSQAFPDERRRIEFLFELYEGYITS